MIIKYLFAQNNSRKRTSDYYKKLQITADIQFRIAIAGMCAVWKIITDWQKTIKNCQL